MFGLSTSCSCRQNILVSCYSSGVASKFLCHGLALAFFFSEVVLLNSIWIGATLINCWDVFWTLAKDASRAICMPPKHRNRKSHRTWRRSNHHHLDTVVVIVIYYICLTKL